MGRPPQDSFRSPPPVPEEGGGYQPSDPLTRARPGPTPCRGTVFRRNPASAAAATDRPASHHHNDHYARQRDPIPGPAADTQTLNRAVLHACQHPSWAVFRDWLAVAGQSLLAEQSPSGGGHGEASP